MRNSDDHQLVARIVSEQDTAAFGELVRRHQSQVRNFLRKLTAGSLDDLTDGLRERIESMLVRDVLDETPDVMCGTSW